MVVLKSIKRRVRNKWRGLELRLWSLRKKQNVVEVGNRFDFYQQNIIGAQSLDHLRRLAKSATILNFPKFMKQDIAKVFIERTGELTLESENPEAEARNVLSMFFEKDDTVNHYIEEMKKQGWPQKAGWNEETAA